MEVVIDGWRRSCRVVGISRPSGRPPVPSRPVPSRVPTVARSVQRAAFHGQSPPMTLLNTSPRRRNTRCRRALKMRDRKMKHWKMQDRAATSVSVLCVFVCRCGYKNEERLSVSVVPHSNRHVLTCIPLRLNRFRNSSLLWLFLKNRWSTNVSRTRRD